MKELFKSLQKAFLADLKSLVPMKYEKAVTQLNDVPSTPAPDKLQKIKDFKWPFYKIATLNTAFTNYLYSIKDENSELFARSNLMFVVGPEKIGKSWFIKYNLRFFDNHNQLEPKPLIMHWNLEGYNLLGFDTFIYNFDRLLIKALSDRWKQESEKGKEFLGMWVNFGRSHIVDIFLMKYDPTYVKYYLTKSLKAFMNDEEHFSIDEDTYSVFFKVAGQIGPKINIDKNYMKEQLQTLISSLVLQFENNEVLAALMFLRSLTIAMELEQRPEMYQNLYYRNGIETTDFLFDVINYISGYHKFMHYVDLRDQGKDVNRIMHSLLIIENFDTLLSNGYNDQRVKDFLDHIILRMYTDLRMRTHFPVVIESHNNRFFNRIVFDYLHEREDISYPALELIGWMNDNQDQALSHIFTQDQIDEGRKVLGSHLKDWHTLVNVLLTEENPNFQEALKLQHPLFQKERILFKNKLNKFFTHPLVGELLDQGTLEYHLIDFFERISSKELRGLVYLGQSIAVLLLMENPVVKALIDVNILYDRKYFSMLHFQRKSFMIYANEYVEAKKKQMSTVEKLEYERHKRKQGLDFMHELSYDKIKRHKTWYEEPKTDLSYEIREYHPKRDPENTMLGSGAYALFL